MILATQYSEHRLKTKNLLAILTNGDRFIPDKGFKELAPKYNISAQDISSYIRGLLANVKDISISQRNLDFIIKATINGEEQLAVNISKEDYLKFREQKIDSFSLVEKYYGDELKNQSEVQYRMKR